MRRSGCRGLTLLGKGVGRGEWGRAGCSPHRCGSRAVLGRTGRGTRAPGQPLVLCGAAVKRRPEPLRSSRFSLGKLKPGRSPADEE